MSEPAHRRPLRVALFGLFGTGNFGNEASLDAMLRMLRRNRPWWQVSCICADPMRAERLHNLPTFGISCDAGAPPGNPSLLRRARRALNRLRNWPYALHRLRQVDLLLMPGTGLLDDFYSGPWGVPYAVLRWCLAARLTGTRVAFVNIGAGPIRHPLSRRFVRLAAARAQYRSYRDEATREFMRQLGFDVTRDQVFPDLAFSLPAPEDDEGAGTGGPLTVGLGVMSYYGWAKDPRELEGIYAAYAARIAEFGLWLLDRGHHVLLLTGDEDDASAAEDIRSRLRTARPALEHAVVLHPAHSLQDVLHQIARTDLVVATRFHNVVAALMLGRPTLSLGYAPKNDVLLADMGLGEFCLPVEEFSVEALTALFSRLAEGRFEYRRQVLHRVEAYRNRLAQQESSLLEKLQRETHG